MRINQKITHNLLNVPGWSTSRHIVVLESDDWGAIRMPSKDVYDILLHNGYAVDIHPYEKYDSIASEDDLCALFDVLRKYKDKNGNHPVITANCVVANPDFDKIRRDNYQHYHCELITETMRRYKGREHSFMLWEQGMNERLFHPQFHGREHLNVAHWMNALHSGDNDILFAFNLGMMGIFPKDNHRRGNVFQVALNDSVYKGQPLSEVLTEGLVLFEKLFGYRSETFIAPCYTWSPSIEQTLHENGVSGLQGVVYQRVPGQKHIRHWQGTKNKIEQIYTIRNCSFEPTINSSVDALSDCLCRIDCAFRWHKPAIISTHRVNYIGAIHEENRTKNLEGLNKLLTNIIKRWPDVEFMTSDQLVNLISKKKNEDSNSSSSRFFLRSLDRIL